MDQVKAKHQSTIWIVKEMRLHQFIDSANHDGFHIPQPMQGWLIAQVRHLNSSTNTGKFLKRTISEKMVVGSYSEKSQV
jgi:hypothetical protein